MSQKNYEKLWNDLREWLKKQCRILSEFSNHEVLREMDKLEDKTKSDLNKCYRIDR